ncbi:MAG: ACP phosphodiesterase [Bacteroidia bacterium]|nr:ACP phosphodiesterase [Bacteroidia bacterium]MDW8236101.1 ACP phosphodiesterase [Bacteroidia bacterium]
MHHLGHIFLAKSPPAFRFGAFIADGVRGMQYKELPLLIQKGVQYHRWIDWRTDQHPAFLRARRLLAPAAGKYAGLIVDLWLDAVLGENWSLFAHEPLPLYEARFRKEVLLPHKDHAPESWKPFLQRMQEENLLQTFGSYGGMSTYMRSYIQRRSLPLSVESIEGALQAHAEAIQQTLLDFWREAVYWQRDADEFVP